MSLIEFAKKYFAEYISSENTEYQNTLVSVLELATETIGDFSFKIEGERGCGNTTWAMFIYPIWLVNEGKVSNIVLSAYDKLTEKCLIQCVYDKIRKETDNDLKEFSPYIPYDGNSIVLDECTIMSFETYKKYPKKGSTVFISDKCNNIKGTTTITVAKVMNN